MITAGPDRVPAPNWYDVLDVDRAASSEEIREAWRAAIADLTPADRRFRLYNRAAEVLLDPERRALHDAELGRQEEDEQAEAAVEATTATPHEEPQHPAAAATVAPTRPNSAAWRPAVPTWLVAAVALLAALAVAATAYLWSQPSEESVLEAAAGARSAAERAVVPVLSYDHRTLEQDQTEAHEWLTSDYREDYDELFAVLEENAPSTRTVVDVEMVASAVSRVSQEGDRVEVLLFVDRPTTNKVTKEPVVYKDQVTLTMELVDGNWLVDDLRTSPALQ